MSSTAARVTKYAADRDKMICLLLDIRGRARENTIQVFSYSKNRVVNLPRRYRTGPRAGQEMTRIETPDAKRWAAVSVPTWLANAEGLYGKPDLPPLIPEFCRQQSQDMRTPQMIHDDGERALAEFVVAQQNRYRRQPGQRLRAMKADRRNANIFA